MAGTQLDDDRFTPASIRQRERSARQPDAPASEQEPYDREFDDIAKHSDETAPEPQLYSGGGGGGGKKKGLAGRAGKAAGLLKNKKFKLIAGGLGVSLPLIVSLLLQISSLLFPNITAHIDGNRMRRLTRQFVDSTDTIISQKVALDTTSDQAYKDALETYRDDGTGLMSRINRLRPTKVAEQMLLEMEFVYGNPTKIPGTGLTREKLVAVKINGETIPLPENSRGIVGKVTHPIDYLQARMRSKVAFRTALGVNGRFASLVTTRGRAAKLVREKIGGVRMYRWTKDEVDKATREAADPEKLKLEALKESYKVATADGDAELKAAQGTHSDDIKQATEKAAEAEAQCVENPDCLEQLSRSGTGIAPTVDEIVTNSFKPTAIKSAMHTIGTVYDVASILCLMYDSTVQSSLGVMEAYTAESVRTYHSVAAASDAQIYTQTHPKDPRTNLKLTGAYAAQLGDAEDSVPEQRANTGVGDTSESPSPLGSAAGLYGTDALGNFMAAVNSGTFQSIATPLCSALTNVWTGGVITLAELGFTLVPGIGQAIKAGGRTASAVAVKVMTKQLIGTLKHAITKKELLKLGASAGAAELGAWLARVITYQRLAVAFNGLAVGPGYVNQADAGATVFAADVDRHQNASVPISTPAYLGTQTLDNAYQTQMTKQKSIATRYFALSNPYSLTTRLAMATQSKLQLSSIPAGLQAAAQIFNPFHLLATLPIPGIAKARADDAGISPIQQNEYGVMPYGWTVDEENAYTHDPEYAPLYNQKQLDNSGKAQQIADKFGKCFDESLPELVADGSIYRDSEANVVPAKSLCSSYTMGDSGPDGDGKLTFSSPEAQLAFRWRVSIRNNNAADELLEIQDPSDTASGTNAGGTGLVNAEGYSWPLEPQTKIDYNGIPCEKTTCHHDGTAAADLFYGTAEQMGGKKVYAISDGVVLHASIYHNVPGCYEIQFHSTKDNYYYWYGHLQNPEQKLLAATTNSPVAVHSGEQIAEVAVNSLGPDCRGSTSHLHIDRGCVRNGIPQQGGSVNCRDPSFIPFMNDMWSKLPPP